ncbi:hypothetical protein RIF29_10553 [Crotalaria pallida]|uniref:Uncharacterized protein n=1 Tax=Crotalaria pallida TaxID=3830 RepID=A0AAN9FVV1_CROPI
MYHQTGKESSVDPWMGQWNMINKKIIDGGKVRYWARVNFSTRVARDLPSNFCFELIRRIKRICETELGIVSQCCQPKQASKMNKQYLENIALKINVKVISGPQAAFTYLDRVQYSKIELSVHWSHWIPNLEEFMRILRRKAMIENVRTRLDDAAATVLSAILEATRTAEKKVKVQNSGGPIPCFMKLEIPLSLETIFTEVETQTWEALHQKQNVFASNFVPLWMKPFYSRRSRIK